MANYYVLLTDYGKSFIANAQAGSQLALTDVVLGDANDQPYLPDSRLAETSLVHQKAKIAIASIKIINDTTAEVSAVVPSNVGGFNLHEVGITDSSGKLVYVGNFHGGYRPTLTEGAGGDMELIFTITADNLATVVIEMDGNVVIATRDWVADRFALKSLVSELHDIINQLQDELMATQFEVLSGRIKEIEDGIAGLLDLQPYKVGDIYQTTINHLDAAAVATHHGYGTWERFAEGRTLVGLSKKASDPSDYKTIGNEFGENEETLTLAQIPNHDHTVDMHSGSIDGGTRAGTQNTSSSAANIKTNAVGGGEAHNNIQPSKVVGKWLRTA
ncbi:phage tail protein [Psychrobacter sp. UBA6291]|uniref:phage tail-collar fiber domain-containing protein n=1 Tax=Psychrobacter sp. UBA6291 TaxID=1947357 RepID=UPI00257E6B3A|nr:phage tail protein [Psychrobacter sp. UBA6291]